MLMCANVSRLRTRIDFKWLARTNSKNNEIMKTIEIGVLALAALLCGWSCDDAELSPLTGEDDVYVYLEDATSNKVIGDMVLVSQTSTRPVTIRLNHAVDHDVTVHFALFDDEMLAELNRKVNGSFKCIPTEYVDIPESVVIPAGQVNATFNLTCDKFSMEGEKYAIPYYITSAEGASVTSTSSRYAWSISAEIGEVPCLIFGRGRSDATRLAPCSTDSNDKSKCWRLGLDKFTLEWWVKAVSYPRNNQALFWMGDDNGGNSAAYARFGDADYYKYNYLQIKLTGKEQKFDTGDPNKYGLTANRWYHFALVFDGSEGGLFTLYMDGEPVIDHGTNKPLEHVSNLEQFMLDKMDFCDTDTQYRQGDTYMCQYRLWKTVRTQEEIQKYMYVEPQYTDPDLVFYLPMNEGEGDTFHDVTGNGHDGVIGNISNGTHTAAARWSTVRLASDKWPE